MKKILSCLLALISLFSMASCAILPQKDSGASSNSGKEPVKTGNVGVVNFLDFEEYNPDFQLFIGGQGFGKISQNSDLAYVKSGKYSAKVQPIGLRGAEAKFYYPLFSELNNFDYSDMSKIDMITMAAYNAESENKTFTIGFGTNDSSFGGFKFTMKPGWNNLAYFPDLDLLNIASDIYDVAGLSFTFESSNCYYLEDAPTYYFDDITFHYDENKTIESVLEYDEGEIIGFEKDFHNYAYSYSGSNADVVPDVKIVSAVKEGITATQGEKVLKIVLKPDPEVYGTTARVKIPEKIIRECGILDIPKNLHGQYALKFDSYAATRTIDSNCFILYGKGDMSAQWYSTSDMNLTYTYGRWSTHSMPLSLASSAFRSDPGAIEFVFYLWPRGENADTERVVYIDNIRLERMY